MDFLEKMNAEFKNCDKCKNFEIVDLAGHQVCCCRSFQTPNACTKKELTND